jgi:hypothetical protein
MARSVKGAPLAGLRDLLPDVPVFDRAVATGARASPAPAPGRAPSWVNVAIMPPRPQGQLPVPGVADLASLVLRRCYERLQSGRPAVSVRDVAALLKLQREVERDDAVAAAVEARARAEMFQRGLSSTLWAAKRHIDPARWRAFMDDLRRECEPSAPRDTPSPGRR